MNSTVIHPALAVDYARTRNRESVHHAEHIRRANAFRGDPAPRPAPRHHRFTWPRFGLRPVT